MKQLTITILACLLFVNLDAQLTTVHIVRDKSLMGGTMLPMEISVNNEMLGELKIGEHLIYKTDVLGEQVFHFRIINVKKDYSLSLKPGKTYYLHAEMKPLGLKITQLLEDNGEKYISDASNFKANHTAREVSNISGKESTESETMIAKDTEPIQNINTQLQQSYQPSNEKRIALLIGNANYTYAGSLANPLNDARDMATTLERIGFDVTLITDAGQEDLKKAIDKFGMELKKYDIGLFYYAGHGLQSKNFNYFIPVDAKLENEAQVEFDCVRTDRLLRFMEGSGTSTNIIILDACRNNPFERSWNRGAGGNGLAFMDAPSGSIIAYATAPGRTASDGTGNNGLYTSVLLEYIQVPGLTIEQMFKKVREKCKLETEDAQVPWESTSLTGDFYFVK